MLRVQAAASSRCLAGGTCRLCQPSTLRSLIWPLATSAQNSRHAVSAQGSKHCVLMRRLNSSCSRSIALVVRIERHWLGGKRRKENSRSPASAQAVGDGRAAHAPLAQERGALGEHSLHG